MEVRELLSEYGFPGDDIPVIKGSALQALEALTAGGKAKELKEAAKAVYLYGRAIVALDAN